MNKIEQLEYAYIYRKGDMEFISKTLGSIIVPNTEYKVCPISGEELFGPGQGEYWVGYVNNKVQEAINNLPIEDFIATRAAAEFLKMEIRALRRNHQIRRGMIFRRTINRRHYYHKRSLSLYKENGRDGRFFIGRK